MTTALQLRTSCPQNTAQLDYILLDGSGSMSHQWWDVLASLDAYTSTLRAANINSHLILSVFDTEDMDSIQRDETLDTLVPFSTRPAGMHGGRTPLYDAINLLGRRLRELDPQRCSVVIATDGDENASRYTDATQAKAILDWMRAKGWQITFIGCDFNNSRLAERLGAKPEQCIGVSKKLLTDAGKTLGEKRARHALYGTPMHFTDAEKQQFGGLLPPPGA